MKKTLNTMLIAIFVLLCIQGCSLQDVIGCHHAEDNDTKITMTDNNASEPARLDPEHNQTKHEDNTSKEEVKALNVPWIMLSQDTFDSDNFSMILAAIELHRQGYIKLLCVDVTGRDIDNKGGLLFSLFLHDTDIPIFINQNQLPTRVTPSSRIYKSLDKFQNDGLLDNQRQDSTEGLATLLKGLPEGKKVLYVSGGHLNNIADLISEYPTLVADTIEKIVVSTGWNSRTNGKPEMNLSQGLAKPTGASAATQRVFKEINSKVQIIIASDPDASYDPLPLSIIHNHALKYLVRYGHYADGKTFKMGDFEALMYATFGTLYKGTHWAKEIKSCFKVNSYGAVTIHKGDCTHYYLDDIDTDVEIKAFEELM